MKSIKPLVRRVLGPRTHVHGEESFSQCGEDLIVDFALSQMKLGSIRYLDLGAHHPTYLSNTYRLYRRGHQGVCVEPDPVLFRNFSNARKRDICLNVGVGISRDNSASFYVMSSPTLSTFDSEQAERLQKAGVNHVTQIIDVPLIPVNDLICDYFPVCPNFISLDIEGGDLDVLRALDLDRYRPEVFCVETVTYSDDKMEVRKVPEIAELMEAYGYFVYADTYINTIFVEAAAWSRR